MSYLRDDMTIAQHTMAFATEHPEGFVRKELLAYLSSCGVESVSSIDKTLQRMVQSGVLNREVESMYRMNAKPTFTMSPTEETADLYTRLHNAFPFLNIAIWNVGALMPLMHHIPNIRMTVVYVEKDGFLDVAEMLGTLTDKLVFRTPSKDELVLLAFGRDFIVTRPLVSQSPLQTISGVQCPKLEKILVDILCDEEFYYLRGNETYYIYESAIADYSVKEKTLLRYAGRRGVADEVKQIIKTNGI